MQIEYAGKRVAVGSATHWWIANSVGLLSRYVRNQWGEIEVLLHHLPTEYRKSGTEIVSDEKLVSNGNICCALDILDTFDRG